MRCLAGILLFALGGFAFALPASSRGDNNADIAVIDRALSTARPGDKFVRFGDVGITIDKLRALRARLAGDATTELQDNGTTAPRRASPRGAEPMPNADTPNGATFKWPSGNVYYRFDPTQVSNSTITAAKMQQFRDSVAEWAAFANLHFIENITGQPNFVTVQESTSIGEGGFSSSVGMAGGEQFVQISPTAWNRGTICHEVGHALGFYHEQQRDDRNTYVTINFGNMAVGSQPNFAKLPGGSVGQGAYDFYSVMHYARNALSNNGQDTISMQSGLTQFANIIGAVFDRTLSKLDRAGMAAVYGNPSVAPSAVVTNTNDSGPGSLRTAIYYAFDLSPSASPAPVSPSLTTISFHIPTTDTHFNGQVFTIKPSFVMTAPGEGTTIDATTQTVFTGDTNTSGPEVVLDGSTQATYEFAGVFGPAFILRQANCAVKGFVVNKYDQQGIALTSDAASGSVAIGSTVSGCYLGTDATGTTRIGNGATYANIEIIGDANHNIIGGTTAAARNVISGGAVSGVGLHDSGTNSNIVEGNYIGLTADGSGPLANANAGVQIQQGAQNNIIGGTTAGARNIISGNTHQGIVILGSGTTGNVVEGNYIGLNAGGTSAVANGSGEPVSHAFYPGIGIFGGAQNNFIGGTVAGAANVISGNIGPGITVSEANTNGNTIQGNFIGTTPAGTSAIANGDADVAHGFSYQGVAIFGGAQSTLVGGTVVGAGNLISGNAAQGVFMGDANTMLNLVQGNIIGLNVNGTALPNGSSGVGIFTGSTSNTIGGTLEGARNVISGNSGDGITIGNAGTSANIIQGNFIGLNPAGTSAIGNTGSGVAIFSATNNTVGGTSAGARNYISGNSGEGIAISASGTTGNVVQGNTIGLNFVGAAAGNLHGVSVFGGAQSNTIGGSALGAGNIITASVNEGIAMFDATDIKDVFSRNSIFANGEKGILLFNSGNSGLRAPTLSAPVLGSVGNPSGTDVSGSAPASSNLPLTIEFFASPMGDPSGSGEGQFFIGSTSVGTSGGSFSVSLGAAIHAGYIVSATATDSLGNTSEFSVNQAVVTTDSDSDGVPDNWMNAHFGHPTGQVADKSRATDDADGDGLTNAQEFWAGLDPKSPNSVLRVTSVARSSGNVLVGFPSVTGKVYQLQFRDDLAAGNWNPLVDGIVGTGATVQITDPSSVGLTKRFYRVALQP